MTIAGRSARAFTITAVAVGVTLLVGGVAFALRGNLSTTSADAAAAKPAAVDTHSRSLLGHLVPWHAPSMPRAHGAAQTFAAAPRVVTITVPASQGGSSTEPAPVTTEPAPPTTTDTSGGTSTDDTTSDTSDDSTSSSGSGSSGSDDSSTGGGE